jgi:hypothetical protein
MYVPPGLPEQIRGFQAGQGSYPAHRNCRAHNVNQRTTNACSHKQSLKIATAENHTF